MEIYFFLFFSFLLSLPLEKFPVDELEQRIGVGAESDKRLRAVERFPKAVSAPGAVEIETLSNKNGFSHFRQKSPPRTL